MSNIYYSPEKYGLKPIAEIDFSDGCYQFDILAVWQSTEDGRWFYAEDSGCSCPSPFEAVGMPDLVRVQAPEEIISRMEYRLSDTYWDSEKSRIEREIADFKSKVKGGEFK